MMKKDFYEIGDKVIFNDSYWGRMVGTIDLVGKQGDKIVYGIKLANKAHSCCKLKNILGLA